jgi:hypothetical protein
LACLPRSQLPRRFVVAVLVSDGAAERIVVTAPRVPLLPVAHLRRGRERFVAPARVGAGGLVRQLLKVTLEVLPGYTRVYSRLGAAFPPSVVAVVVGVASVSNSRARGIFDPFSRLSTPVAPN